MLTLRKSSPLTRQVAKWKASTRKAKATKDAKRVADAAWDDKRRQICDRDGGRDRAFGWPTIFQRKGERRGNPARWAACHHVIFRSAGGSDDSRNLINVSQESHSMLHGTHDKYDLDATGNGDKTITFTLKLAVNGELVNTWTTDPRR